MKTNFKNFSRKLTTGIMALAVVAFGLTSCSKDDEGSNGYKVRMTDSPGSYTEMNLEITKVEAFFDNEGWVTLDNSTKSVNVISLTNGSEVTLAQKTDASLGAYSKIRISYGSNNDITTSTNGVLVTSDLTMSGSTVIETNQEVTASGSADVLLDFNVAKSVTETGGAYFCDPVITVIDDEETGIRGEVEGGIHSAIIAKSGNNEYSTYTDAQGRFLIRGMKEGTYNVDFFAKDSTATTATFTQEDVVVTRGEITNMGTVSYN